MNTSDLNQEKNTLQTSTTQLHCDTDSWSGKYTSTVIHVLIFTCNVLYHQHWPNTSYLPYQSTIMHISQHSQTRMCSGAFRIILLLFRHVTSKTELVFKLLHVICSLDFVIQTCIFKLCLFKVICVVTLLSDVIFYFICWMIKTGAKIYQNITETWGWTLQMWIRKKPSKMPQQHPGNHYSTPALWQWFLKIHR